MLREILSISLPTLTCPGNRKAVFTAVPLWAFSKPPGMGTWSDQTSLHSPASWEHLTTNSIPVSHAKLWSLAEKKNALPREQSAANPQEENSLLRGRWLWHQGSPAGTTQRCSVLEGELSCIFSYRRITKRGSVVLWFCFQHKYLHFLLTQEFTAGCSTTQVRNLFLQMLEQLMNLQALVMLNAICRAWNPDRPQSLLFIFRFSFIYDALKQNKKTEHSTATPYC